MSHVPTRDGLTGSEPVVAPDGNQDAKSPAIPRDPTDSEQSIDLPTYVSLTAEQGRTSSDTGTAETDCPNPPEPEEKLERLAEQTSNSHLSDRNRTVVKEDANEDVPLLGLHAACVHPATSPVVCDPQRENARRGRLTGSKVMKRSPSVISDSGIESEPSSVAWPLDAALRAQPPQDFSSELEIRQQVASRRPVHRSSLEGLQMESNGSLPSAGIQASLTSISSLPYEEDQQQRQLRKLTKSVSAPQISSPEDAAEDRVLLNQDAKDSCNISCSLPNDDFDPPSFAGSGLTASHVVHDTAVSEMSDRSEGPEVPTLLTGASEVPLLQEPPESSRVREAAVVGSQEGNTSYQTRTSGASSPQERVHLGETETAAPRSRGNDPCACKNSSNEAGDEGRGFRQAGPPRGQGCLDTSQPPLELSEVDPPGRPGDLSGLVLDDSTPPLDLNGSPATEKAPFDCQAKPSKVPSSGLSFVNKKMVEMVNMSVSCAPTCLPFSSVLRDSPSISGLSPRQATSPITHQPLGSFGIISSTSLSPLNMDDATSERMLK